MVKIKLILLDDDGKILQEREQKIDTDSDSFSEIEQAVEVYQQKEMKAITKSLFEEEQKNYLKE